MMQSSNLISPPESLHPNPKTQMCKICFKNQGSKQWAWINLNQAIDDFSHGLPDPDANDVYGSHHLHALITSIIWQMSYRMSYSYERCSRIMRVD